MDRAVPFLVMLVSYALLAVAFAALFIIARKQRLPVAKALRRGIVRFLKRDLDAAIDEFSRGIEVQPRAPTPPPVPTGEPPDTGTAISTE